MKIYVASAVVARWKQLPGCPEAQGATTNRRLAAWFTDMPTQTAMEQFEQDTAASQRLH